MKYKNWPTHCYMKHKAKYKLCTEKIYPHKIQTNKQSYKYHYTGRQKMKQYHTKYS